MYSLWFRFLMCNLLPKEKYNFLFNFLWVFFNRFFGYLLEEIDLLHLFSDNSPSTLIYCYMFLIFENSFLMLIIWLRTQYEILFLKLIYTRKVFGQMINNKRPSEIEVVVIATSVHTFSKKLHMLSSAPTKSAIAKKFLQQSMDKNLIKVFAKGFKISKYNEWIRKHFKTVLLFLALLLTKGNGGSMIKICKKSLKIKI